MSWSSRLLVLTVAALFFISLVPTANAQGPQNTFQVTVQKVSVPATDYIMPITGDTIKTVTFEARIQTGTVQPTSNMPISITVSDTAGWLSAVPATGTQYIDIPENQDGSTVTRTINVDVLVAVEDTASAYETGEITVTVNPQETDASTGSAPEASATFKVKPDYYSITSFQGQTILKGTPSTPVVYPITIVNNGNGDTVYTVNVDGSRDEWSMTFSPPQLTIPPQQSAGENNRKDVTVSVLSDQNTQYSNDLGTYTLEVTPTPKNKPGQLNYDLQPVSLNSIVHIQGVYVPGFEVPVAMAALSLVGLMLGRRRFD